MRIGIIGSGVAGSLLAEGLLGAPGHEVTVFERAAAGDHAEAGTGLNLGPNALKALRLLGAAPVVAYFAKQGRVGHARTIAGNRLHPDAIELRFEYPYTTEISVEDPRYLAGMGVFYEACADAVAAHLGAGRDVAPRDGRPVVGAGRDAAAPRRVVPVRLDDGGRGARVHLAARAGARRRGR